MITLTRLNGARFVLNCDLIRTIEEHPDTVNTLVSGEKIVVSDTMRDVVRRTVEYGRLLRRALPVSDAEFGLVPGESAPAG